MSLAAANSMRLARALALLGVDSRRGSEELIRAGQVAVNGRVIRDVATNVVSHQDQIALDGRVLPWPRRHRYYAVNKPPGVTSTVRDPHADRTVVQLVPTSARLFPVGRLDLESEGLILLTDDGELANRVMHPKYEVEKEYEAQVSTIPPGEAIDRIRSGITLDGQIVRPEKVRLSRRNDQAWVSLVLREGRKHEVRRLLGAVGLHVQRLVRIRIGSIRLGSLPSGGHRTLTAREIDDLLGKSRPAPVRARVRR